MIGWVYWFHNERKLYVDTYLVKVYVKVAVVKEVLFLSNDRQLLTAHEIWSKELA